MDAEILTAIDIRLSAALASAPLTGHVLRVDGVPVGIVDATRARRLAGFPEVFVVGDDWVEFTPRVNDPRSRSAAIADVARELAREGRLSAWRDELFAVSEGFGTPPAFVIERAAARYFGIRTWAAHVNAVVREPRAASMWFARRSEHKAIDPGMLDNLVGGGIAAGQGVRETMAKEAWEEAGIPAALSSRASVVGSLDVCRVNADGIQRETIFVHDLWLPADFAPVNQDGEAVEHRRVTWPEAAHLISIASGPDQVTVDASLVVVDFLLRHQALPGNPAQLSTLRALARPVRSPLALPSPGAR
ncbi:MAG TPA: DUF4743 domain-containing protein [Casimicrobiaceae bacterium]|nr:DUF4743 domain-containing protein [Casimicrobiaceae bacterium]